MAKISDDNIPVLRLIFMLIPYGRVFIFPKFGYHNTKLVIDYIDITQIAFKGTA